MDRLTASAHRIAITGKSLRKKITKFEKYHSRSVVIMAGLAGVLCSGINEVLSTFVGISIK